MRLYATIDNDKGKSDGLGSNEHVTVHFSVGNKRIGSVTLAVPKGKKDEWALYASGIQNSNISPEYLMAEGKLRPKATTKQRAKGPTLSAPSRPDWNRDSKDDTF